MIAYASSCGIPWPKNSGAEPTPPKLPHPSAIPSKLIGEPSVALWDFASVPAKPAPALSVSLRQAYGSFGQVHPRQLVAHVPQLGVERVMDQPSHHLDGSALRADHVRADRALHDLEVPDAPDRHALVELDQELGERVQLLVLTALRVDLDEREARPLPR